MPFNGSTGPVVHVHGLTGLRKAICESRPGYLYLCAWCAWKCESVALMFSHKMDFMCCTNNDGFRKSSHNLTQSLLILYCKNTTHTYLACMYYVGINSCYVATCNCS